MMYAIDTEFIDTPTCSALISLAIVNEREEGRYYEFVFPRSELTPWLLENVDIHLGTVHPADLSFPHRVRMVRDEISSFIEPKSNIWTFHGAYDWYHFCRLFGGFMQLPEHIPRLPVELAYFTPTIEKVGAAHNALNDAIATMRTAKKMVQSLTT